MNIYIAKLEDPAIIVTGDRGTFKLQYSKNDRLWHADYEGNDAFEFITNEQGVKNCAFKLRKNDAIKAAQERLKAA